MRKEVTERGRNTHSRRPSRAWPPGHTGLEAHPACRLTGTRQRGLVPGVWALRWVSGGYLHRRVVPGAGGRWLRRGLCSASIIAGCFALNWDAEAAATGVGEKAEALVAEVEANASARELVGPSVDRAKAALAKASSSGAAPGAASLLEEAALEWAEVARDLLRASAAERASDGLEQESSAIQTEIARVRSAVEQTMARVGRARQELKELEPAPVKSGVAPVAPR